MQETNSEMWFGTKNVLQNNNMVFEMRSQKWRLILPFVIIILAFGVIAGSFISENPNALQEIRESKTEILITIQESFSEVPQQMYSGTAIFVLFFIFIFLSIFWRPAYIRIDASQMVVMNTLDSWLGRPGNQFIIAHPATLTGQMKGHGKSKRAELLLTTVGGEKKKIRLSIQVFGNGPIKMLVAWLNKNRPNDFGPVK